MFVTQPSSPQLPTAAPPCALQDLLGSLRPALRWPKSYEEAVAAVDSILAQEVRVSLLGCLSLSACIKSSRQGFVGVAKATGSDFHQCITYPPLPCLFYKFAAFDK